MKHQFLQSSVYSRVPSLMSVAGILLILLSGTQQLQAQDSDYEKWKEAQQEAFQDYVDEQNARFAEFLRKNWEDFDTRPPEPVPDEAPKPQDTPVAPPAQDDEEDEGEGDARPPEMPEPPVQQPPMPPRPELEIPAEPEPESESSPEMTMEWHYYDVPFIPLEQSDSFRIGSLSNDELADAWLEMAGSNFEEVIEAFQGFAEENDINEWGYALLIKDYARKVFSGHNEAVFLSWFLLHNSGYHANGGYRDGDLFLLMPVSEKLFETSYYALDEALPRFYVMQAGHLPVKNPGRIKTYAPDEEQALRVLSMRIARPPRNTNYEDTSLLSFSFEGQTYSFQMGYDRNYVSMLEAFPLMRPEVMFATPASEQLHEQIESQIMPVIEGMPAQKALDFLLRFSQKAFEYQTDTEQFGHEKYMTPDQIMYHNSSDCDDRSIFFAYLVRNFMGLEVMAVTWPGHMATAVEASDDFTGDIISFNDKSFLICDPTYIGADSGYTMPKFLNQPMQTHPFNDLLSFTPVGE